MIDQRDDTLRIVSHLITHPRVAVAINNDRGLFYGISNLLQTEADLLQDYSCMFTAQALVNLFASPTNTVTIKTDSGDFNSDSWSYPKLLSLKHTSHDSTILALGPNDNYYVDYYQEDDRDNLDQFPYGSFGFFRCNHASLMTFLNAISIGPEQARISHLRQLMGGLAWKDPLNQEFYSEAKIISLTISHFQACSLERLAWLTREHLLLKNKLVVEENVNSNGFLRSYMRSHPQESQDFSQVQRSINTILQHCRVHIPAQPLADLLSPVEISFE
jgi:hypothetical protein